MKKVVCVVLSIILILSMYSCNDSDTKQCFSCGTDITSNMKFCPICGVDITTDKIQDDSTNNEQEKYTIVELTASNYSSYLSVNISMISQTPTLLSHNYFVIYTDNRVDIVKGMEAPTGANIRSSSYSSSNYLLTSSFSVKVRSKSSGYIFDNASLSLYNSLFNSTIYLDNYGAGSDTFMVTETVTVASKDYIFRDTRYKARGVVAYYEQ